MNSEQLKVFKVIAETENIRKASEILYISAPALSRTIVQLEQELGCALFNRVKKRIYLSQEGETLLKYANIVCCAIDDAKAELIATAKVEPTVLFSIAQYYFMYFFNDLSTTNTMEYRTIVMDITENTDMVNYLLSDQVQAFIDYERPKYLSYDLKQHMIIKENYQIFVPVDHPWHEKYSLNIDEINGATFIGSQDDESWIREFMRHYNVNFNIDIFDRSTFLHALLNCSEPVISPVIPLSEHAYSIRLNNTGDRRLVPIRGCAPRPIYLWWLPKNDIKVSPLLNNLLLTQANFTRV